MAAIIIGIGIVVLHAFAMVALWWELRSHERSSRERVARVLDAVNALREDIADIAGEADEPSPLRVSIGKEVVELPEEMAAKLDRFADALNTSRKQVVEEALIYGLQDEPSDKGEDEGGGGELN